MNLSKKLDLAIKKAETKTTVGAYVCQDKKYDTYMTNEEWANFKDTISPETLDEYGAGSGGELVEKNGYPPKMASYGSSSRMIYMLSRHKDGFQYEKKLSTTIGGMANFDGFCEEDNRYIFVEAKCHEPYSAKNNSVSKSYEKLYNFINDQMADNIRIEMEPSACGKYINVKYLSDGEKIEYFDIKQMICHLLGIVTGILKGELDRNQINFIYLLYDPTVLDLDSDIKEKIDSIYERTCYECNLIDFATLFRVIFAFLKSEKYGEVLPDSDIDEIVCKFTFTLASQEFYPILLQ